MTFNPKLWPSLMVSVVFSLLIGLGCWQVQRYHEKNDLLTRFQTAAHATPLSFSKMNTRADIRFQHMRVTGRYLNNKTLLLQNRFYSSHVGFDVLTPLKIPGKNEVLLVNRGWVPILKNQQPAPIQRVFGMQHLTGYIKVLDKHAFILGKNILEPLQWPLKIQKIDFKQLSELTHASFYPFILYLDPHQPHGFIRAWQPINMQPERHLGYAVQWFAMAVALVVAFFFFSCRSDG